MLRTNSALAGLLLIVSGCSAINPKEGFEDVEAFTAKSLDAKLIWNGDEVVAKEIEVAVKAILNRTLSVSDAVHM